MRTTLSGLVLLLGAALAQGQGIKLENRVANSTEVGVCWWACADMVGREYNILPLVGLKERVLKTGIGRDQGAREEDIAHWVGELGLKPRRRVAGKKDVAFLCNALDDGLPVIISVDHWNGGGAHAVLVTGVTREKQDFDNGKGYKVNDYGVTFVDPNKPKVDMHTTWEWLMENWSGKAYAFDPKEQDQRLVRREAPPPVEAPPPAVQGPPVFPHQLPHVVNNVNNQYPAKQPSNQDIKDGVRRPDDMFRFPALGSASLDYYSEYRARFGTPNPKPGEGRP